MTDLEEDDLSGDVEVRLPTQAVDEEPASGVQIADAQRDDVESLIHADHSGGPAADGLERIGHVGRNEYREYPPLGLGHVARCGWEQRITGGLLIHRVIPDNCADILVGDDGAAQLVGPATRVDLPRLSDGSHVRGLRLEPYAIRAVFGVDADELTDRSFPLDAVLDGRSARLVAEAVWAPGAAAGAWLRERWRDVRPDRATVAIVRTLTAPDAPAVDTVADRTGFSSRHLRRLVRAETGLTPKTLHRVARVHEFLRRAEEDRYAVGAAAAAAGYADQPHASREIRALTGLTPARLLAARRAPH
ncbi:helix-turn-helix domain-containing protein [Cryptosporangium aurantiacum]|uniref:Transcriptional regulator, AraC family n=1 Tax=Cryptosporangium aurantiacum TaxID=134849 RepID=A0A1M7RKT3_9ACTN|nr:AraC family transcriptional regulator [Cryptosporangium aurantiacum]SHN46874.1 transcriptional regulator, AraC family [Cryptosporangium aurantiacum]